MCSACSSFAKKWHSHQQQTRNFPYLQPEALRKLSKENHLYSVHVLWVILLTYLEFSKRSSLSFSAMSSKRWIETILISWWGDEYVNCLGWLFLRCVCIHQISHCTPNIHIVIIYLLKRSKFLKQKNTFKRSNEEFSRIRALAAWKYSLFFYESIFYIAPVQKSSMHLCQSTQHICRAKTRYSASCERNPAIAALGIVSYTSYLRYSHCKFRQSLLLTTNV